jgi:DNA invertase Pin-like site-specific DNA recombinase
MRTSLHHQSEAAHEGWRLIPGRYDDGAFSGASLDRPALQQLLADVRASKIDIVLVYKVDRQQSRQKTTLTQWVRSSSRAIKKHGLEKKLAALSAPAGRFLWFPSGTLRTKIAATFTPRRAARNSWASR